MYHVDLDEEKIRGARFAVESSTLLTVCSVFGLRGGCVTGVINSPSTDASGGISAEDLRRGEEHAVRVGIEALGTLIAADAARPHAAR